ncbi:MAG: C45 family autoproteolytic acyltransferase/hydrolase [Planctomycetota bacterium]|nr:C45 family autoproteolytic acyltransferase/hydrolase [Planctomycetota bacterium]
MNPSTPTRYREITVAGTPREMGRQIGEAAREEVRGFCDVALDRVNLTVPISRNKALSIANESLVPAREYAPHMVEELEGISESAGVSLSDLMLLQVRNQLTPEADAGCTSFALDSASDINRGAVVGQNWDNDPLLDDFTVVLTRRPINKPALMTVTQAGLISYIGLNDAGIGLCLNTLPAPSRDVGVPHYFTVRGIYEARSLDEAVHAVQRAQRAIPTNIMMSTPEGPADLEVTIDAVRVLRGEGGRVTHTNHCLHPELLSINADFPELIQSIPRKHRVDALVQHSSSLDSLKAALQDHDNHPRSICRHANDDPGSGFWVTVFSVIIETESRRMHVSRGTPCDRPFETYLLP